MNNADMLRLKDCELQMLEAFISVCNQLHLKYYLVEGTLLGAVRHQGFIPWDDDIDVGMPRADYECFLKEAQALLPDHYFVQSMYSEPEYHANFAKIRDCRTTFVESSVRDRPINHGVYIDIFPLDYAPESKLARRCIKYANVICALRITQVFTLPPRQSSKLKQILRGEVQMFSNLCFPKLQQAVKAQKRLYTACKQSTLVTNYGSAWGEREVVPAAWYGDGCYLTFEGLSVRVPSEYDKLPTQIYGDYMTPPPTEQQVGHHYAEVIDPDKPYTEYVLLKK